MARTSKGGVNVAQEIRKYLKANAGVGPTDAAKALSSQLGRKISPIYVSNIKSMSKGKKAGGKRGRKRRTAGVASAPRAASNGSVSLAALTTARQLIDQVGAGTAKQLIDLLG